MTQEYSSVLSDRQILKEIERSNIWISPFQKKNLSNNSYDVTLGPNYFRVSKNPPKIFLPWVSESVDEYWGEPQYADVITDDGMASFYQLPIGTRFILLAPGELILAHTNEFIGGVNYICSMMKCRSSLGRCGISVCKDAALGNIGYVNRWTMEVQNLSQSVIPLVVGSRIAQIVFLYTGRVMDSYDKKGGAYQEKYETVDELMDKWQVSDMLPKYRM
jgi:deoxycytidine triphosphate deaminase